MALVCIVGLNAQDSGPESNATSQARYKLSLEKGQKTAQLIQEIDELRARLARLEQAPMEK